MNIRESHDQHEAARGNQDEWFRAMRNLSFAEKNHAPLDFVRLIVAKFNENAERAAAGKRNPLPRFWVQGKWSVVENPAHPGTLRLNVAPDDDPHTSDVVTRFFDETHGNLVTIMKPDAPVPHDSDIPPIPLSLSHADLHLEAVEAPQSFDEVVELSKRMATYGSDASAIAKNVVETYMQAKGLTFTEEYGRPVIANDGSWEIIHSRETGTIFFHAL